MDKGKRRERERETERREYKRRGEKRRGESEGLGIRQRYRLVLVTGRPWTLTTWLDFDCFLPNNDRCTLLSRGGGRRRDKVEGVNIGRGNKKRW